jgi:hypothetical protein
MSAQDWKDELRQAKNAHSFKELNSDWSAFGLKSEKIQPPKQKPFKCDDCTASFNLKSNLQLHRRHQHKYEAYFQFSKKNWQIIFGNVEVKANLFLQRTSVAK